MSDGSSSPTRSQLRPRPALTLSVETKSPPVTAAASPTSTSSSTSTATDTMHVLGDIKSPNLERSGSLNGLQGAFGRLRARSPGSAQRANSVMSRGAADPRSTEQPRVTDTQSLSSTGSEPTAANKAAPSQSQANAVAESKYESSSDPGAAARNRWLSSSGQTPRTPRRVVDRFGSDAPAATANPGGPPGSPSVASEHENANAQRNLMRRSQSQASLETSSVTSGSNASFSMTHLPPVVPLQLSKAAQAVWNSVDFRENRDESQWDAGCPANPIFMDFARWLSVPAAKSEIMKMLKLSPELIHFFKLCDLYIDADPNQRYVVVAELIENCISERAPAASRLNTHGADAKAYELLAAWNKTKPGSSIGFSEPLSLAFRALRRMVVGQVHNLVVRDAACKARVLEALQEDEQRQKEAADAAAAVPPPVRRSFMSRLGASTMSRKPDPKPAPNPDTTS